MTFRSFICGALFLLGAAALSAQPSWTLRHRTVGGAALTGFAAGEANLVAVGSAGRILYSSDGADWSPSNSGTDAALNAAAFGNGRYVAVGDGGVILASTDALIWNGVASGTSSRLRSVVFAQGKFIAVGGEGVILQSTDGRSWSPVASPTKSTLCSLAFGGNFWVASAQDGSFVVSQDGKAWKSYPSGLADSLESVAFCEAMGDTKAFFVALTAQGVAISYYLERVPVTGGVNVISSASGPTVVSYPDGSFISFYAPIYAFGYTPGDPKSPKAPGAFSSVASVNQFQVATTDDGSVITSSSSNFIPNIVVSSSDTQPQLPRAKLDPLASFKGSGVAGSSVYLLGTNETIYQSSAIYPSRLANISVRSIVTAANPLTVGAVIRGNDSKQFLLRSVGPTLGSLGVGGALSDPALTVYDGAGGLFASNAGWSNGSNPAAAANAAKTLGTFALPVGSGDSALVAALKPGAWTFTTSSASGQGGTALFEAYDLDGTSNPGSKVANLSVLGSIATDRPAVVAGVMISGPSARTVLIRAVGPTLGSLFNVNNALSDPIITVYNSAGNVIRVVDGWYLTPASSSTYQVSNNEMRVAAALCGAFPLVEPGNDSAVILNLQPGSYSIYVTSKRGTSGAVLFEVYDIPTN